MFCAPTRVGIENFVLWLGLLFIFQQFIGVIFGAVLSGLIAFVVNILIERKKKRNEKREKHLQELKENCLKPLRDELSRLREHFEFNENKNPYLLKDTLESGIHWLDDYSLKNHCDKVLFDDLPNHFPELAGKLAEVERRLKQGYPEFCREILGLLEEISSGKVLLEISSQGVPFVREYLESFLNAVFLVALGYDKGYWPNTYAFLKSGGKVDLVYRLGSRFSESERCIKAKSIKGDIVSLIDSCIREIDEILHRKELRGRCKYM